MVNPGICGQELLRAMEVLEVADYPPRRICFLTIRGGPYFLGIQSPWSTLGELRSVLEVFHRSE